MRLSEVLEQFFQDFSSITWHCVTLVQPLEKRSNIKREFFFQLIPRLNVTFHIEELTCKICIPF